MVGAPIHVIMNSLFIGRKKRSRNINFMFSIGTSIGGLTPFISGYIATQFSIHFTPIVLFSSLAIFNLIILPKTVK